MAVVIGWPQWAGPPLVRGVRSGMLLLELTKLAAVLSAILMRILIGLSWGAIWRIAPWALFSSEASRSEARAMELSEPQIIMAIGFLDAVMLSVRRNAPPANSGRS